MLADAGIPCVALPADIDESSIAAHDPVETARLRALAKARDVSRRHPEALVLGADQVLWMAGDAEAIGKPEDEQAWLARLRQLRGRRHELTTAVALVGPGRLGGEEQKQVHTGVRFRADVTDDELRAYVAWGEAAGCAGGYMVEKRGAWLIESLDGDWSNVVGLPILVVVGMLRARGWRLDGQGRGGPPGGPGA